MNSSVSYSPIKFWVIIFNSIGVINPHFSLSKMEKISIMSSVRDCLFIFYNMYRRNYWKSMVPLPSSSIALRISSTYYSLTLSPSPRKRNFNVLLVMLPVLSRSYILNTYFSSSICSILYEENELVFLSEAIVVVLAFFFIFC